MSNNYEEGKCYVVSMNKLAKFVEDIHINEVYTFATEWDEDEFIHDTYDCDGWFVFTKIKFNGDEIFVVGRYDGGDEHCFVIDDNKFSSNMKNYIRDFTDGTTISGYVCLDPFKEEKG